MKSERLFDQAVQLATAFVQSGDVRLGCNTREDGPGLDMLGDLIPAIYAVPARARGQCMAESLSDDA